MTIFDYESLRLEGYNLTVPRRSESGDFCSFVLDLSVDVLTYRIRLDHYL